MDYKKLMMEEVAKIENLGVRNFSIIAFNHAAPQFWTSPCSSSGRFHPHEDNGEGGLVRHLLKASAVTEQFARRAMFSQYELDIARAATILHDICKDGNPWGNFTDYRHGKIGAEFLDVFYLEDNFVKKIIMDAVRYHMSPWNTALSPEKYAILFARGEPTETPPNLTVEDVKSELEEVKRGLMPHHIIEKCVQEADYWASRNQISFMPGIPTDLAEFNKRHDALA